MHIPFRFINSNMLLHYLHFPETFSHTVQSFLFAVVERLVFILFIDAQWLIHMMILCNENDSDCRAQIFLSGLMS